MPQINIFNRNDRLSSNCFVISCSDEYCVVDPSVSLSQIQQSLSITTLPKYVLLTHEHCDHTWEIDSYIKESVQVLCSKECAENSKEPSINCSIWLCGEVICNDFEYTALNDGDTLKLGNEVIKVISSKGHSMGGLCYLVNNCCFTGDTIFAEGSYGRYDLPGSDFNVLMTSINKLFALDDDVVIYPGHGSLSTIKETKRFFKI